MKIRVATQEDVPGLVELFLFHEMIMEGKKGSEICENTMAAFLSAYVSSDMSLVLVAEHGGKLCGAFVGVDIQHEASGKKMFTEVHWMSRPDKPSCGLALKRAAEREARRRGASAILISGKDDRVFKILKRSGYAPVMTTFMKEL